MDISPGEPLGIALIVVGVLLAFRLAKTLLKIAMVAVVLIGLYLWLGDDVLPSSLWVGVA